MQCCLPLGTFNGAFEFDAETSRSAEALLFSRCKGLLFCKVASSSKGSSATAFFEALLAGERLTVAFDIVQAQHSRGSVKVGPSRAERERERAELESEKRGSQITTPPTSLRLAQINRTNIRFQIFDFFSLRYFLKIPILKLPSFSSLKSTILLSSGTNKK